jgi:lipid-A-disaccharide synthase
MFIAGEASGDLLAAELVNALATCAGQRLRCFGAGGPKMAAAGVDIAVDLTRHSIIGLAEAVRNYGTFRHVFDQLLDLAVERRPDVIICVDFSGFNRRFARAVRKRVRASPGTWSPRIVQYVSPQVWASRPGRARSMAEDLDLLLAMFPFERDWYAQRVPQLRVEFVGHPMIDRYAAVNAGPASIVSSRPEAPRQPPRVILLLPGSRVAEVLRHLPVMVEAARVIQTRRPDTRVRVVVPTAELHALALRLAEPLPGIDARMGGLAESLAESALAIASTGTVTMECAYFGVPTVALYKTSWLTYAIGKRIVHVRFLAMPNLLAGEEIFPEFVQHAATPERLSRAALELLGDAPRRARIQERLAAVVASLGGPGASQRAARAILEIVPSVRGE